VSYRVFARKYRPQTFAEVVGQEHITRTLQNAVNSSRLAQAYLFVGPRGIGKTSTARILAKALNCESGPTSDPCGKCSACLEIAEGQSLDVIEIDGASNNGVDNIRDLRDNAAYAPTRGKFKIYLIDEVHMLSTGAFNALLKTLEEPPAHVKFIFATTEAQKFPPPSQAVASASTCGVFPRTSSKSTYSSSRRTKKSNLMMTQRMPSHAARRADCAMPRACSTRWSPSAASTSARAM
jgi:DNA polymerase III subunit gamma/tau